jgi:hypothetical protein
MTDITSASRGVKLALLEGQLLSLDRPSRFPGGGNAARPVRTGRRCRRRQVFGDSCQSGGSPGRFEGQLRPYRNRFGRLRRRGRILGFTMLGPQAGEVIAVVQTAMLAGLPYTTLRDAIFTHPTMAEGLNVLFAKAPPPRQQSALRGVQVAQTRLLNR